MGGISVDVHLTAVTCITITVAKPAGTEHNGRVTNLQYWKDAWYLPTRTAAKQQTLTAQDPSQVSQGQTLGDHARDIACNDTCKVHLATFSGLQWTGKPLTQYYSC
jgi:hypothetical protein